jgi:hypothetical protein
MKATDHKPHAAVQLEERYGITDVPLYRLAEVIVSGQAEFIRHGEAGRLIYAVPVYKDGLDQPPVMVNCVYDPHSELRLGAIVTVLPPKLRWELNSERKDRHGQRKREFARDFRRMNAEDDEL